MLYSDWIEIGEQVEEDFGFTLTIEQGHRPEIWKIGLKQLPGTFMYVTELEMTRSKDRSLVIEYLVGRLAETHMRERRYTGEEAHRRADAGDHAPDRLDR